MTTSAFPPLNLSDEIDEIVAERRALRDAGASEAKLEENRKRLMAAQSRLTQLLVARHLDHRN
ncbi:MAG TPA: hypothetical protein VGU02_15000 [Gaiellaceae bacterium]|nr:hypothetical protein [Gaiellaceae bacterium]